MTVTPTSSAPSLFESLYRVEFPRLVAIARRIVSDSADAEDVAQEAFVSFAKSRRHDDPNASSWLRAAAAHGAFNAIRGRRRRTQRERRADLLERPLAASREYAFDPAAAFAAAEQRTIVREAMRRLRRRDAAILALRFGGDLTYQEIADALGLPAPQIGTLLARAERALAQQLDPQQKTGRYLAVAVLAAAAVSLPFLASPVRAWTGALVHLYLVRHWTTAQAGDLNPAAALDRIATRHFYRRPVVAPLSPTTSDAARRAGFSVSVPAHERSLGPRRVYVDPGWSMTWTLSRSAAARFGYDLPQRLEGVKVTVDTGTLVQIRYGDGTVAGHLPLQSDVLVIDEARIPRVTVTGAKLDEIGRWYASVPGLATKTAHALANLNARDLTLPAHVPRVVTFVRNGRAFAIYGSYSAGRLRQIAVSLAI